MHRIFISYRRSEAAFPAGALGRELKQYFGETQVFRDREDVEGGMSWRSQVLAAIDRDSALLVLIDEHWLEPPPGHDKARLFDADDPVRLEILDALQDGATVLPLLLEGAEMPSAAALPAEMRALSEINALSLRDGDWNADVARLCATLEHLGFTPLHAKRYRRNTPFGPRTDSLRPITVSPAAPAGRRSVPRAVVYLVLATALAAAAWLLIVRPYRASHVELSSGLGPGTADVPSQPSAAPAPALPSVTLPVDAGVAEPIKPVKITAEPAVRTRSAPPKPAPAASKTPDKVVPSVPATKLAEEDLAPQPAATKPVRDAAPEPSHTNPLDMQFQ